MNQIRETLFRNQNLRSESNTDEFKEIMLTKSHNSRSGKKKTPKEMHG